jgi:hypothetical protein
MVIISDNESSSHLPYILQGDIYAFHFVNAASVLPICVWCFSTLYCFVYESYVIPKELSDNSYLFVTLCFTVLGSVYMFSICGGGFSIRFVLYLLLCNMFLMVFISIYFTLLVNEYVCK